MEYWRLKRVHFLAQHPNRSHGEVMYIFFKPGCLLSLEYDKDGDFIILYANWRTNKRWCQVIPLSKMWRRT